jgi:phospholipid transport system substrate-binding protein
MTSLRRHVALVLALAVAGLALAASPAGAGAPLDQLRLQVDRVLKVLDDAELKKPDKAKDRRVAVRKIANEIFDFSETAKRSLGRHWLGRTPAEQAEFVQVFTDLLERSYISKVELYGGEKMQYVSDAVENGDQAKVQTKLMTKQGGEIPIEYRMHKKAERWLVYDVVIEGVSLVSNYRTQFNKIIQTSSFQELVKKMKSKQEELASGTTS